MVARHAVGTHGPEVTIEPGPELLQAHPPTLTCAGVRGLHTAYARAMIPGTGSGTWDTVLQVAIAVALLISIVLLIKNYRGR